MNAKPSARLTAVFVLFEGLLIFIPLGVLGAAIGWPASLDDPASVALPRLVEQAGPVAFGYTVYLIYSVLFLPVALLIAHLLRRDNQPVLPPALQIAVGFASVSALARCLGIIRWLSAMPVLARQYVDPAATDATRQAVEVGYNLLNSYGGTIGEALGVSLFAALWLLITSVTIVRGDQMPKWLGIFGLVTGAMLVIPMLEIYGLDLGPIISISSATLHFWYLALAIVLFTRKP